MPGWRHVATIDFQKLYRISWDFDLAFHFFSFSLLFFARFWNGHFQSQQLGLWKCPYLTSHHPTLAYYPRNYRCYVYIGYCVYFSPSNTRCSWKKNLNTGRGSMFTFIKKSTAPILAIETFWGILLITSSCVNWRTL